MKSHVYSLDGKKGKEISLPRVFSERYLPAVIARAVIAKQTERLQPKGADPMAGLRTTAEYIGRREAYRSGINKGLARLPHVKLGGGGIGQVKRVPNARGGRRSFPPKAEKVIVKGINRKELALATRSAIAATTQKALVTARGHIIDGVHELPIVFEDTLEAVKKTKDAIAALQSVGLGADLQRARVKKVRAGQSTMRGNRYRRRRSVLIVVSKECKALRNVPGVDIARAGSLGVEALAPGATAGRLTVYTESAVRELGEKYGN